MIKAFETEEQREQIILVAVDTDEKKDVTVMTVEQSLDELQELTGQGVSIEFVHDNKLSDGQCQIETAFGVFDCSVDTELSNLMKDIRSLV